MYELTKLMYNLVTCQHVVNNYTHPVQTFDNLVFFVRDLSKIESDVLQY